jgi:hypothetical protein
MGFRDRIRAKTGSSSRSLSSRFLDVSQWPHEQTQAASAPNEHAKDATPEDSPSFTHDVPKEDVYKLVQTTPPRSQEELKPLYRQLDADNYEIRLLVLDYERAPGNKMIFSLEYASLIDPPSYTALSYCWGDANEKRQLTIKDWGDIEVTANLAQALRYVLNLIGRGMKPDSSMNPNNSDGPSVRLWVDAICINQEDRVERSQQVRHMRQIYSRAKEVISWVSGDEIWNGTGSSAKLLDSHIKQMFNGEATVDTIRASSYHTPTKHSAEWNKWVKNGWKTMDVFFSQPYWTRVWVIQEVAVASKVRVLCGSVELPWDGIAAVLKMWKENPEIAPPNQRAFLKAVHLLDFRDRFLIKREPISLLDAMRWSYETKATDPRDKIFALLGLCHDGPTFVPVPNYKQPVEDIIADMSRAMMTFDRSLDLMCLKGTCVPDEENPKLPSWTPNWVNLWSGSFHSMTAHEAMFSDWHSNFSFNPILEGSNNKILKVKGINIGEIYQLTSPITQPGQPIFPPPPRAPWISSPGRSLEIEFATQLHRHYHNSIWKTLTMGLLPPEKDDIVSRLAGSQCFSKLWTPEVRGAVQNLALIEWIDRNAWLEYGPGKFQYSPPKYESYKLTLREWSQVERKSSSNIGGWETLARNSNNGKTQEENRVRLIETFIETLEKVLTSGMCMAVVRAQTTCFGVEVSDDDYIVMVPLSARVGDSVYLVRGSTVPMVLRYTSDTSQYRVMGGVYMCDSVKSERHTNKVRVGVDGLDPFTETLDLC